MTRTKGPNPLATGAIGVVAGTVIRAATGVILSNKKARATVVHEIGHHFGLSDSELK